MKLHEKLLSWVQGEKEKCRFYTAPKVQKTFVRNSPFPVAHAFLFGAACVYELNLCVSEFILRIGENS